MGENILTFKNLKMKTFDEEQLKRIFSSHTKWLNKEGGERADLSNSDLSGLSLRGSNLSGSNLSGSNLRDSDLSYSCLRNSNLSGSNISGSDLSGSDIDYAIFCCVVDLVLQKQIRGNVSNSSLMHSHSSPIAIWMRKKSNYWNSLAST